MVVVEKEALAQAVVCACALEEVPAVHAGRFVNEPHVHKSMHGKGVAQGSDGCGRNRSSSVHGESGSLF